MYALAVTGLPLNHIDTVWNWFCDLPLTAKKQMLRDKENKEQFAEGFENELVYLVFDGGLLGFVSCEYKEHQTYEIHLFCPRHTPPQKLAEAISTFFQEVRLDDRIQKLICNVRGRQIRLGQCLINEGCVFTGWTYRSNKEQFHVMVWEK